jgi:hypothetical protein
LGSIWRLESTDSLAAPVWEFVERVTTELSSSPSLRDVGQNGRLRRVRRQHDFIDSSRIDRALAAMKTKSVHALIIHVFLLGCACHGIDGAYAATENSPPKVCITWPRTGQAFSDEVFKIEAEATDTNGSVTHVQFFANTNLIGIVSNAPYAILWQIPVDVPCDYRTVDLKAVAVDNIGAKGESTIVKLFQVCGRPPFAVVSIRNPANGTMFSAPATFEFAAELLASQGEAGPIEFFVGTTQVGRVEQGGPLTATTPPASIRVSNLVEGEYKLSVRYPNNLCTCESMLKTINVVRLGLQSPRITASGRFQCEVLTSFRDRETVIQASSNLVEWIPISTNAPGSTSFVFSDGALSTNCRRFYRALMP